jgi:hypothetical protein
MAVDGVVAVVLLHAFQAGHTVSLLALTVYQKQFGLGPFCSCSLCASAELSGVQLMPYASPVSGVSTEHAPYATCTEKSTAASWHGKHCIALPNPACTAVAQPMYCSNMQGYQISTQVVLPTVLHT